MNEKIPTTLHTPDQSRIDQEFYSTTSRWFNSNKEELLAQAGDNEEDQNYAFYQDQLRDQVASLAQPKLLDSKIKRDGSAEKYGPQEARARAVAEGMAVLGFHLSRMESLQSTWDDPNDPGDKGVYAKLIKQTEEAKKLFIQASEKVFTPIDVNDPKQEVAAITQIYDRILKEPNLGLIGSLQFDFEHLGKSLDNPAELQKELTNTIDRLGSQLGGEVHYLAQNAGELSLEQVDKKRLELAAGNKLLYRLVSVQDKLASSQSTAQ